MGNVVRAEPRRRHLVEQRPKAVVVVSIDDDDVDGIASKLQCCVHAAEAGADDDDPRSWSCRMREVSASASGVSGPRSQGLHS